MPPLKFKVFYWESCEEEIDPQLYKSRTIKAWLMWIYIDLYIYTEVNISCTACISNTCDGVESAECAECAKVCACSHNEDEEKNVAEPGE